MSLRQGVGRVAVSHKGNRWYVHFHYRTPAGQRKKKWVGGFLTEEEARAAEAGVRAEWDTRTVGGYLNQWVASRLEDGRIRPSTGQNYRRMVRKHVTPTLGKALLAEVGPEHIEHLYQQLRGKGLGNTSLNRIHAVLKTAFAECRALGGTNVVAQLRPPKADRFEPTTWTPEQVSEFLDWAEWNDPKWQAFWYMAALTGARKGELCGFRAEDIDLDQGTARVVRTVLELEDGVSLGPPKTPRSARTLELPGVAVEKVREHIKRGDMAGDDWLFAARDRLGPTRPSVMSRRFSRNQARMGTLPRIRFHDLRHSFCTNAAEAGVRPEVLQKMVGHSNITTTLGYYVHVRDEAKRSASEVVAAAVFGHQ